MKMMANGSKRYLKLSHTPRVSNRRTRRDARCFRSMARRAGETCVICRGHRGRWHDGILLVRRTRPTLRGIDSVVGHVMNRTGRRTRTNRSVGDNQVEDGVKVADLPGEENALMEARLVASITCAGAKSRRNSTVADGGNVPWLGST